MDRFDRVLDAAGDALGHLGRGRGFGVLRSLLDGRADLPRLEAGVFVGSEALHERLLGGGAPVASLDAVGPLALASHLW